MACPKRAGRPGQQVDYAITKPGTINWSFAEIADPAAVLPREMVAAGVAWGVYSLRGQGGGDAIRVTAGNFLRCLPFAAVFWLLMPDASRIDAAGVGYALASGALESSNVDLTQQLVGLMEGQRNYQANTKVLSTNKELTQVLFGAI